MRITTLLENTATSPVLVAEHGLSLHIETNGRRVLFDMGQTDAFAQNAATLGIDLSAVDTAVLSHGHYDHGGGLKRFLELNDTAPVYLHRFAFEPHFNGTDKYIGLDTSLSHCDRLRFCDGTADLGDGLTLVSFADAPRLHPIDAGGLTVLENGSCHADDFRHEHYLLIEEHGRRICISGCSHKGVRDIVRWCAPDVLIGGFHLSKYPCDDTLLAIGHELAAHTTTYYTCHCTGLNQYRALREVMPRLHTLSCGDIINI